MYSPVQIFGYTQSWYYIMQGVALIVTIIFFIWQLLPLLKSVGIVKALVFIPAFILFMYMGCRVFSLMEQSFATNQNIVFNFQHLMQGQLRWYGAVFVFGITGIFILGVAFPFHKTAEEIFDILGMSLCLFAGIVKLGCQFSGDGCYGHVTNMPWGMHYLNGSFPSLLPVHPTPLYDSIYHIALFTLLFKMYRNGKMISGSIGFIFLISTALFNFLLGYLRDMPILVFHLSFLQVCYLSLLVIASLQYFYFLKKHNYLKS